ncbi:TetR family transcriptional regulator [Lacisediminihabitans sp. H27-G8]|uniref:TetR/AcrR family transcriptional regulator n=1 Tax=Lacisediminihabitans sp. H27-G8 TaxID=3111909 RepID=UPI0038FBECF3
MSKSDDTRAKITETAIESFRERGYDQTTIRLIAEEAGISVGNAYYYFPTKNHLVQELYLRVQGDHLERVHAEFGASTDIAKRLEVALLCGMDATGPYHDSAAGFLAAAISPTSAVSPFGADSAGPRAMAIEVFQEVVDGSTNAIPVDLKRQLPELLWLAYMGLTLYWVYDTSEGQAKSRALAKGVARLIGTVLPLARLPFARGPVNQVLELIRTARP